MSQYPIKAAFFVRGFSCALFCLLGFWKEVSNIKPQNKKQEAVTLGKRTLLLPNNTHLLDTNSAK